MWIILSLFLISCSVSIYAQQRQIIINGFVFDKDRKEPLQSATVNVEAGDSPKISRQTDELGRFRLTTTNRGLITISINYIGYPFFLLFDDVQQLFGNEHLKK